MKIISKIRFLPLTIFFAVFMLTIKLGSIWGGLGDPEGSTISIAGAGAQQTPPASSDPESKTPSKTSAEAPDKGPGRQTSEKTAPDKQDPDRNDPALLTHTEIGLLQQLADRRMSLEVRNQQINQQAALMKAAERRIDKKIEDLKTLRVAIEGLIKNYDDQQASKMKSLVKIYEAMKPKDAARIFEELDMETLLLVAERMKERKLAPIMAKMNPKKAKTMTVELTKSRQLPNPGS